jgi:Chitobiase/beta-hexosaminidase C-terminal domain/Legume lectin domain
MSRNAVRVTLRVGTLVLSALLLATVTACNGSSTASTASATGSSGSGSSGSKSSGSSGSTGSTGSTGSSGSGGSGSGGSGSGGGSSTPTTISGTPSDNAQVGLQYSFVPSASGPSGEAVSFSIQNKPAWATFNATSGLLAGTPVSADVGADKNVVITASTSDGGSAALAAFTITVAAAPPPPPTTATPVFSFANFSSTAGINLDDAEGVVSNSIKLAGNQVHDAGQAWYSTKQDITSFTTDFTFKITSNGYGETFVIQNSPHGMSAGGDSNGLGYFAYTVNPANTAITKSVAIAFNATPNGSSGSESYTGASPSMTGLYLNGGVLMDNGIMPVQDLIPQGINLQSGDVVSAHVVYDGSILSMNLTDTVTGKQAYFQWPVDIPAVVGANTAYIGFTGGTINAVPLLIDSWSWSEGYNTRLAQPTFSPVAGAYTSSQSVTIAGPSGATIYYTTNGKPPTTASSVYSGPITVGANEVVQAIAVESGYTSSEPAQANYQVQAAGSPIINFASGFGSASGLVMTAGTAAITGSSLQLTDDSNGIEIGSAFYDVPVNVQAFTTQFTLNLSGNGGQNTLLFVIQNQPPAAADSTLAADAQSLSPVGGAVSGGPYAFGFENFGVNTPDGGYAGLVESVAVKFDGFNGNTTGEFTNGETPYEPQTTTGNIDLNSGHPITCTLAYDGTTLTLSMKDTVTGKTYSTQWTVDIPSQVGGDTAYVGFTASLYTGPSQQNVSSWTYAVN